MVFKKVKRKQAYENLKKWQAQKKDAAVVESPDINIEIEPRKTRLQTKLLSPVAATQGSSNEPPRKRRNLSSKKYSDKPIVIDDDAAASASGITTTTTTTKKKPSGDLVETLQLQCWREELSSVQQEMIQKREKEYNEIINKLESLAKQNGGECVYKGESCTAYQFSSTPPALSNLSNGPSDMNTVVLNKPTTSTTTNAGTYKLVMDPRLGLIVGTMTPTQTSPQQPATTPALPQRARRTRSINPAAMQTMPTTQYVATTTSSPATVTPTPSVSGVKCVSVPPAPVVVRPAESTAVGGLAAGTGTKPAAIVDLTADDGRPPADSREVAFNKLQGKTFPSLVVVARPHLRAKENNASDRSMLDSKVKSVLVRTPTKFTEWLIQQGLVRSEQYCTAHQANKLNLGMYSDVSKFPYSGGYVWISECCPHRFVSVFSGSLFEGAAHPPTILLKLLYHWSCQTNIQNVVQWVKVDNLYVKGLFTWLRAVCSFTLQQHMTPLGGPGKKVEVGVISLGTTSQDGSQRQVKVEVLGILDPEKKYIRLRAVEPLADGERNYKRRFSKILEPLRSWVHPDSIVATDLTVDKGTLHFMGFSNILQSTQTGVAGNQAVMEYLRKIVPRMFQNTLSLLSRQIIQQFLDELVWREWYGQTPGQAFNNMVLHLAEQTRMNVGESLIQRLNKVAANPFKNHFVLLQPRLAAQDSTVPFKRYGRKRVLGNANSSTIIDLDRPMPNFAKRSQIEASDSITLPSSSTVSTLASDVSNEAMVPLESYYYGIQDGDPNAPLAQKVVLNVRCCVCKVPYSNNIALLDHLLAHAHNISSMNTVSQCRYCLAALPNTLELSTHIQEMHPVETGLPHRCVLCETRFMNIYALGKHLSKEHVPQELPYQCGTCGFRCSSHKQAVDHFYETHDGAATLQCPFCLKSTAVWSSGRIMSTNVTFFLAHLQKHQKKATAKKCNLCALWFIQKETLKEHQHKAHMSLVGCKGVRPYSLPNNYSLVPKSKTFQHPSSIQDLPTIDESHNLTLILPAGVTCVECGGLADSPSHYPQRSACDSCRYVTDCAAALVEHRQRCTADMPTLKLKEELHCCCGYSSNCGNKMAKHLALCERKTAYPTADQAKMAQATDTHSMLDVLGLVRKQDDVMEVDDDEKENESEEIVTKEAESKEDKMEVTEIVENEATEQASAEAEPIKEIEATDDLVDSKFEPSIEIKEGEVATSAE